MINNCYYEITITGKYRELRDGVNQIYEYLVDLAKDQSLEISREELLDIEDVLRKIDNSDKNCENLSVAFSLGHTYEPLCDMIGYEEAFFPAAKLMPTAKMVVDSDWDGPGDEHTFFLKLENGIITVSTYDNDADMEISTEEDLTYTLVNGEWILN